MRNDICSLCCGTEREQTVDCPLDCEFLQAARQRDKPPDVDPGEFPNKDIQIPEKFLREHESLLLFMSGSLLQGAMETQCAIDNDIKDCLDALVRTHKTLQSGIYYDSRPANQIAGAIYQRIQTGLEQYRRETAQRTGMQAIRDLDVLGVAVFLQRLEIQHNNGRRRGKSFIDFLRHYFAEFQAASLSGAGTGPALL